MLGDRLCICDNSAESHVDVWVMKDGEMLFQWWEDVLFTYHPNKKTLTEIEYFNGSFWASQVDQTLVLHHDQLAIVGMIDHMLDPGIGCNTDHYHCFLTKKTLLNSDNDSSNIGTLALARSNSCSSTSLTQTHDEAIQLHNQQKE
ncbi:hypothetical protein HAX54_001601 [Datura stramonium]|uniref:Uncharacterized protein n=1 Tax=Datura stramonium TaxID=4076 RepID=A0ABS8T386_DATST|nr:hypothetical protein [Datura stramonium]